MTIAQPIDAAVNKASKAREGPLIKFPETKSRAAFVNGTPVPVA